MSFHGGNIYAFANQLHCLPNDIIDFSSNIHFEQAIDDWRNLTNLNLVPYADPHYSDLKQAIKQRYALTENVDLEVFNGASSAIFALLRFLTPKDLVFYTPLYGEYGHIAKVLNSTVHTINRFNNLFASVPENSTVVFVNPSTPDGMCYEMSKLFQHWQAANCTVIIDESFLDFCDVPSMADFIASYDKLFIVKSLCKFYGCAGVRIGFVAGQIEPIAKLRFFEPMWKLSSFDMAYMQEALKNNSFIEATRNETIHLRAKLEQILIDSNLFEKIYDGSANFVLGRLKMLNGEELQTALANFRILIRNCESFEGLDNRDVRFAVKSDIHIKHLAHALKIIND